MEKNGAIKKIGSTLNIQHSCYLHIMLWCGTYLQPSEQGYQGLSYIAMINTNASDMKPLTLIPSLSSYHIHLI
uniref:Uncharacterized protein n=1 Tax=Octopus bimaculoides TaxID=37653 RepID=A0A0L8GEY4_OCTBM